MRDPDEDETRVSLAPLDAETALWALLAIDPNQGDDEDEDAQAEAEPSSGD